MKMKLLSDQSMAVMTTSFYRAGYADGRRDTMDKANDELITILKKWDALIHHKYSWSREAMSDMIDCARETRRVLYGPDPWPNVDMLEGADG